MHRRKIRLLGMNIIRRMGYNVHPGVYIGGIEADNFFSQRQKINMVPPPGPWKLDAPSNMMIRL